MSSCSKSNKPPHISRASATMPAPVDGGAEVEALHRAILELAAKPWHYCSHRSRATGPDADHTEEPLQLVYLLGSMLNLDLVKEQSN